MTICLKSGTALDVTCAGQTAQEWMAQLVPLATLGEGATLGQESPTEVVLDLGAVTRLDSAGVQLILGLEQEVRRRSGSLRLTAVSSECERVFGMLSLEKMLGVLSTGQG